MCVFLQRGEQIATLDSMSHRSIFNEYVNTIQPYLLISVIILLKREWYSHGQEKQNCGRPTQRNTAQKQDLIAILNIWGGDAVCKKKGLKMKGIDLYMKVYNQKKTE